MKSTYILYCYSRFDVQGKEILKTQEKIYLAEPALRYSVLGYSGRLSQYVLRADAFAGGNYEGIKTMHIADFLLSDEY